MEWFSKNQTNVGSKWDKSSLLKIIVGKTKIIGIKIQQIRESCGIRPKNEWVERRRRELDQHTTRVDAERLIKISKDNILVGRISSGRPERR